MRRVGCRVNYEVALAVSQMQHFRSGFDSRQFHHQGPGQGHNPELGPFWVNTHVNKTGLSGGDVSSSEWIADSLSCAAAPSKLCCRTQHMERRNREIRPG
jgi:hypothetical protein